jgi:hypothetical protein
MRGSTPRRWWGLAARTRHGAAGRPRWARVALTLGLLASLAGAAAPGGALFEVRAPEGMVTGRVRLEAVTRDAGVAFVRWQAEDWSRTTGRPFELSLDVGPAPREKTVVALALDRDRRPLYRIETLLNPGGRRLALQFLAPLDGQHVAGATSVLVRAAAGRRHARVRGARRGRTQFSAGRGRETCGTHGSISRIRPPSSRPA